MRINWLMVGVLLVALSGLTVRGASVAGAASSVVIMRAAPCPPIPPGGCAPNWVPLLSVTINPQEAQNLFVTFSSEVGLFTLGSNIASGAATTTTTTENASLMVRLLVDGIPVTVGSQTAIPFDTLF